MCYCFSLCLLSLKCLFSCLFYFLIIQKNRRRDLGRRAEGSAASSLLCTYVYIRNGNKGVFFLFFFFLFRIFFYLSFRFFLTSLEPTTRLMNSCRCGLYRASSCCCCCCCSPPAPPPRKRKGNCCILSSSSAFFCGLSSFNCSRRCDKQREII